jgi:hypothetical protein
LPDEKFSRIIDTVLYGIKHVMPELMEVNLLSILALTELLSTEPTYATIFYQRFYAKLLFDTLQVMTDYEHVSGFKEQAQIL